MIMKIKRLNKFLNAFKEKNKSFKQKTDRFFKQSYNDLLILSGLFFIVFATFLISKIAGFYCLGIVLLLLGIWFTLAPPNKT